jgi:hypothetical protein
MLFAAACSGTGESTVGTSTGALSGPLEVRVMNDTDNDGDEQPPIADAKQIVVTINRIDAKVDDGGWTTLSMSTQTIDLMALQGGTFATLGIATFPAGGTERLRLFVVDTPPSYVVTADGALHPLVVPSGDEAGIEVVGDFDIAPCATGQVTLAFAGKRSILVTTDDGPAGAITWHLRPVIRLKDVLTSGTCPRAPEDDEGNGDHHEGHGDPHAEQ